MRDKVSDRVQARRSARRRILVPHPMTGNRRIAAPRTAAVDKDPK